MRLAFSFLFLIGTLCSSAQKDSMMRAFMKSLEENNKKAIGQPFPSFVVSDGKTKISNESLHGKVVLINFWFATCHPCLVEFDALNQLYDKLKNNKNFEFISCTREDAVTIKTVKQKFNLKFKIFEVDIKECNRLNINKGYPSSILLDKNGNIKYLFADGFYDKAHAREYVMATLLPSIKAEL